MNVQAPFCAQRISQQLTRLTQTMRALRVELEQVCRQLPVSQPARG
ncbi:hypothetical protein [Rivihabitans pingtungensis]|jgi:hypothetical protein|nr:hypothetical protein [Rivihabitans pingtungensis]